MQPGNTSDVAFQRVQSCGLPARQPDVAALTTPVREALGELRTVSVQRQKVLMIATDFTTPYRVLRCAHAAGAEVYVLGNAGAKALRFSRYCKKVVVSDSIIHGGRDQALAIEINCVARALGINMVMPADAPSVRAILTMPDLIEVPCFPLPNLQSFDMLNNKWAFAQLCAELNIRHPATWLLPDVPAVAQGIADGTFRHPLVVKALSRCASAGVIVLDGTDTERRLQAINYTPILLQEFILGEDIGASVYARNGKIEAFVAHWLRDGIYSTFCDDGIYSDLEKITSHFGLDGVYNFDMVRISDGSVYYLECNPRFFYKINLSMIAGINFAGLGLRSGDLGETYRTTSATQVRFPKAALRSLISSGRYKAKDWGLLAYLLSDPWPFLMEKLNLVI